MTEKARKIVLFACLLSMELLAYPGLLVLKKPWKFGLALCDGVSWGEAWLDRNRNGHREPDESGLEGVCIWDAFQPEVLDREKLSGLCEASRTDENGHWAGGFKPGAAYDEVYIMALPPEGYRATTPSVTNGCEGEFGLKPVESSTSKGESGFEQHRRAVLRAKAWRALKYVAAILAPVGKVVVATVVSDRAVTSKRLTA